MPCIVKLTNNPKSPMQFTVTQDEWPDKWTKSPLIYDIIGTCRTMEKNDVKKAFNYATTTWEIDAGIKCVSGWGNPNADIKIDFKNKDNDDLFKTEPDVLAYAYFPKTSLQGQLVFNNDYIWSFLGESVSAKDALAKGWVKQISDPNNTFKTYSIVAVMIHEFGHTLGLTHDVSGNGDGTDVMDAYYSGKDRIELSPRDIARIRTKYGEQKYSFSNDYTRLKNAIRNAKERLKSK